MESEDDSVSSGTNEQVPSCDADSSADVIPVDDSGAQERIMQTDAHVQHDLGDGVRDEGIMSFTGRNDAGDQTQDLPVSAQVIVSDEEPGEDLSSVGMSSVASSRDSCWRWEEQTLTPFSMIPTQLRSCSSRQPWTPSYHRGRQHRWDDTTLSKGRLHQTRRLGEPTRHAFPHVLQDHDDIERPGIEAPGENSSSDVRLKAEIHPSVTDKSSRGEDDSSKPPTPTTYTTLGAMDSKYSVYACLVDSTNKDRAVEIQLASFARPHMRAFHLAWLAFFVAFFTWFALTPLLSEIARSLDLTKEEIWTSSICGVAGSAVTRIFAGPICDKYGARWAMAGTLILSAIPTALTGLVQTGTGLNILRLFIGLAGSAFVASQYWTSSMFISEVAGTANALVAGWGNLGGGVTQIVMGSLLFPLLKIIYGGEGWTRAINDETIDDNDRASDLAWRTACVVPALLCLLLAWFIVQNADDSPKGNYSKRNREGYMSSVSARKAIVSGLKNFNTWILFIQYGCCFGVEITMVNAAALYFKEKFGLSTESAAATASIFGWMNLFARGAGGFLSDIANAKWGMRGRLWVQVISLVVEGVFAVAFAAAHTLAGAIVVMIVFSCFVQASAGSTFSIVPYVNPAITGSISGIVGAGGNVGGVVFATIFRSQHYHVAFSAMGWTSMISALLTVFLLIRGHAGLCCAADAPEVQDRRTNHVEEVGRIPAFRTHDLPDSSTQEPESSFCRHSSQLGSSSIQMQGQDSSGPSLRVAPA